MGLVQRLSSAYDAFRGKQTGPSQEVGNISAHSLSPLLSPYENLFAQVRPLIDEMKCVIPYGVGANGAKRPTSQTPELATLIASPNDDMGWAEFADLMFATWLTEPELNIHVWKKGRKVEGYTILPAGARRSSDNDYFYTFDANGNPTTISRDEVMTLRYSRSPRNPQLGVSPASSVIVWTQLDDLVSQYERAYFENGAVPATITFIRSSTQEGFERKRRELQEGLKGARNRNKTVYAWRAQLDDGTTGDEVEVKTIQGNNSSMAIRELVAIIDQRLRQSIGVSPFIMGDDSSAKYDNAELSDLQFTKRRVYPALVTFWSQFEHELARVKGGLSYAINFDLEIPELTDRLKVKAETSKTQAETLIQLLKAGASPAGAVEALELGDRWNETANDISAEIQAQTLAQNLLTSSMTMANDEPNTTPQVPGVEQDSTKGLERTTDDLENPMQYEPMFEEGEELEEQFYQELNQLAEDIAEEKEPKLDLVKVAVLALVLTRAKDGAKTAMEVLISQSKDEALVSELTKLVKTGEYEFSDSMKNALKERIDAVVDSYKGYAREVIKKTLEKGSTEGWSQKKVKKALREALPKRQAELIARNEVHAGLNFGRYDEDIRLAQKYGLKITLKWHANPGACDICSAMNGTEVPLGEVFPDHAHYHSDDGEEIEVHWEHSVYNADGKVPNPHPNCRCTFNERFE